MEEKDITSEEVAKLAKEDAEYDDDGGQTLFNVIIVLCIFATIIFGIYKIATAPELNETQEINIPSP